MTSSDGSINVSQSGQNLGLTINGSGTISTLNVSSLNVTSYANIASTITASSISAPGVARAWGNFSISSTAGSVFNSTLYNLNYEGSSQAYGVYEAYNFTFNNQPSTNKYTITTSVGLNNGFN